MEYVAWVRVDRAALSRSWLLNELEAIREGGEARVVVLDATGPGAGAVDAMSAEELRALTLFALPVVCCFEGELGEGMAGIALAADIRVCGTGGALAVRPGAERLDAEALLQAGLVTAVAVAGEAGGGGPGGRGAGGGPGAG